MAYTVAPFPYHQFFDDDGFIAAGHKLYTYESGTTTALATYSDSGGTANANPIVLDSAGRAKIFCSANAIKFVLKTAADVTVWTIDDVYPTPEFDVDLDVGCTAGEAISAGECCYLSDGSGSLTAGRWYLADSDLVYASLGAKALGFAPADIASGASSTMRVAGRITGLSGLSAGSIYYPSSTAGAITATAPTTARIVGAADSTTSLVLVPTPPRDILTNLASDTTQTGNVGAGEDDLISISVPAALLGTDGNGLKVLCWGTTANNADAKTLKVYFGTDELVSLSLTVSQVGHWTAGYHVIRTGAATQKAIAQIIESTADGSTTATSQQFTSPTQTLSGAVTVKCTGEGVSNDDIVQEGMVIALA